MAAKRPCKNVYTRNLKKNLFNKAMYGVDTSYFEWHHPQSLVCVWLELNFTDELNEGLVVKSPMDSPHKWPVIHNFDVFSVVICQSMRI